MKQHGEIYQLTADHDYILDDIKKVFISIDCRSFSKDKSSTPERARRYKRSITDVQGQKDDCTNSIFEVYFLFDVSMSFYDIRIVDAAVTADNLSRWLAQKLPGSKVGYGIFSDKVDEDANVFEKSGDQCFKNELGLQDAKEDLMKDLIKMKRLIGSDIKEAQLDALLEVLVSSGAGWSFGSRNEYGQKIHRVVILATDSKFHTKGDLLYNINNVHGHDTDYPSVDDVVKAYNEKEVIPIILLSDPLYEAYEPIFLQYIEMLNGMKQHGGIAELNGDHDAIVKDLKMRLSLISCGDINTLMGEQLSGVKNKVVGLERAASNIPTGIDTQQKPESVNAKKFETVESEVTKKTSEEGKQKKLALAIGCSLLGIAGTVGGIVYFRKKLFSMTLLQKEETNEPSNDDSFYLCQKEDAPNI